MPLICQYAVGEKSSEKRVRKERENTREMKVIKRVVVIRLVDICAGSYSGGIVNV